MLPSINFNDKIMTVNVEINDIVPDVFLSVYSERKTFQEKIPKLSFRIGHVVAEIFCKGNELFIVVEWHDEFLLLGGRRKRAE